MPDAGAKVTVATECLLITLANCFFFIFVQREISHFHKFYNRRAFAESKKRARV